MPRTHTCKTQGRVLKYSALRTQPDKGWARGEETDFFEMQSLEISIQNPSTLRQTLRVHSTISWCCNFTPKLLTAFQCVHDLRSALCFKGAETGLNPTSKHETGKKINHMVADTRAKSWKGMWPVSFLRHGNSAWALEFFGECKAGVKLIPRWGKALGNAEKYIHFKSPPKIS